MLGYRFSLTILLVVACSLSPIKRGGDCAAAAAFGAQSTSGKGTAIHLTRHKVMDKNGTGKLAGTYLLPDGFTATDQVKWIPNDYLTPVVGTSTLKNKDESVIMESMSGLQINFGHGPAGATGNDPPESVCAFLLAMWIKQHPGVSELMHRFPIPILGTHLTVCRRTSESERLHGPIKVTRR